MNPINALVIPNRDELETMKEFAKLLAGSGMIPDHFERQPGAVFAIMQKGVELGIPPMYALNNIAVIKGKATANSELMLALIYRDHGGSAITFTETNAERCTIEYQRRDGKQGQLTYTMEEAVLAGHPSGANRVTWQKYPANMLRARCVSAVARMAFADSIGGMYTPEELDAPVDDEGNIVHARSDGGLERANRIAERMHTNDEIGPHSQVEIIPDRVTPTIKARVESPGNDTLHAAQTIIHAEPIVIDDAPPAASGDALIAAIPNDDATEPISKARMRALWGTGKKNGWNENAIRAHVARNYPEATDEDGASSIRALTMGQAQEFIDHVHALDTLVTYAAEHEWKPEELEQYCIEQFPELNDDETSALFLMSTFEREAISAAIML